MGDPKTAGRKHERRDIEPGRHRVQTASVERTDLVRRPTLLGERARSLSPDTTGPAPALCAFRTQRHRVPTAGCV